MDIEWKRHRILVAGPRTYKASQLEIWKELWLREQEEDNSYVLSVALCIDCFL